MERDGFSRAVDPDQFVEQDPGPRGSPQLPHGAGGACVNDLAGVLDCAAKTESCFCNSTP
jgi:hypothetical protein